ncbi:hypothetical protein POM88_038248 [Heracleum sosnowskyi]|uniref:Glutamate-1-semialdehyde 2,1-aminomutase n=1 Tax=Heracleum sosnowskyi TaxID=360622 RepID=A0AAD8HS21_9APIA|nr:hypothetical protein POM88_038248 [Heracleum sosnowskyi]
MIFKIEIVKCFFTLVNCWHELIPRGVNSPVRAFKLVGGQPIVIDSVKGSHMWDINGNEYIDYVGSWGPAIIGHADDERIYLLNLSTFPGNQAYYLAQKINIPNT